MKGLLYYKSGDLRYSEEVPEPIVVNDNDVKIKIAYCGICGTDLHEYLEGPIFFPKPGAMDKISGFKLPLCPGHEMSGVVTEVGSKVTNVKPGDHVVVEASSHCSDRARYKETVSQDIPFCSACKAGKPNICKDLNFLGLGTGSGGFGQFVVYGADHVLKLPDFMPLDVSALCEPISVAWHAVELAKFKPGQTALVLGGGPIGLAAILALKGHKAGRIVVSEPALIRRQFAQKLGAEVFNPLDHKDAISDLKNLLPETEGFDASFDCSGVPVTFQTSIEALGPGGIAVNVAIWADKPIQYIPMDLTYQEKFATGSMGYVVKDFAEVIHAFEEGLIPVESARVLITGKVTPKETVQKGFKELIDHKEANVKILVTPNGEI
ncbi:DEKNAAC100221 [Brettanomyces naardenensis]|uniref:DEKNAAC100221 n=1 Tax=Brettanomyces naardenensis TaxID=13370 RepID=A0A448YFI8_BRENA|nr:DEKNAAC100221 [Brettanomyces naardenensis]